jgi:hypothetical protein
MQVKKMSYDDFDKRIYAKGTDVVPPVVATIEDISVAEMPRTKEKQLVAWFPKEQFRFGVILSAKVNREALARITGSRDPMDAIGTTVELFNDPTVRNPQTGEFGAVRIRAPRNGANGGEKPAKPRAPVLPSQVQANEPERNEDEQWPTDSCSF